MKMKLFTTILAILSATVFASADDSEKKAKPQKKELRQKTTTTMELHITGMKCHNCSDAVEDALAELDGIEVVSVDAKTNLAVVKYLGDKVKLEQMVAAIKATDEYVLEKTVSYSKLEYENDGSFSFNGKPFTGTATDEHKKSGNKSKNYQFKDGKLHGLVREWYDNGKMSGKKLYKEGKRHGKTEYWDEKGKLTATKIYKDDVHVDEDGKPVED